MNEYKSVLEKIVADNRYQENLDWGVPRKGHPEGTVRAHIAEIEFNLEILRPKLTDTDYWKLKLLIHTHDSLKAESTKGVRITHPQSHASLARQFLQEFCDDKDLLAMVQYHDEPYAIWRHRDSKGHCDPKRFDSLLFNINDWNLFLAFNIIDGSTDGKNRDPLHWLFRKVEGRVHSEFTCADIL